MYDAGSQTTQVWVRDLTRGVETRLTSAPSSNATPVWSPDGARVAFQSDRKHQADVYVRSVDATGTDEAITDEDGQKIPTDWSSDGRLLAVTDRNPVGDRRAGISAIPLDGDRKPLAVIPRMADSVGMARVSPDGRWLLYDTDESGRQEIYVASFPAGRGKVQVSNAGGVNAIWSRGGREVVYIGFDRKVMAVAVDTTKGFHAGAPSPLFQLPEGVASYSWDLSSDGQRFLVNVPVIKSSSAPLSLVMNWAATLRR